MELWVCAMFPPIFPELWLRVIAENIRQQKPRVAEPGADYVPLGLA